LFELNVTAEGEEFWFERRQQFGGAFAIFRIRDELGWNQVFGRCVRGRDHELDSSPNVVLLFANRLLGPTAKIHILE
jgi:hypothetical protein